MLSVSTLSIGMLSVSTLIVAMLSVTMLSVVMLSVSMLKVVAPERMFSNSSTRIKAARATTANIFYDHNYFRCAVIR